MEFVVENNKRWYICIAIVHGIVFLQLMLFTRFSILFNLIFIIFSTMFFCFLTYLRNRSGLIYFSHEGIVFKVGRKNMTFDWENSNVEVISDHLKYLKIIDCRISSTNKKNYFLNFSISYENEKSILSLTQKYVPENHSLKQVVNNYAKQRG